MYDCLVVEFSCYFRCSMDWPVRECKSKTIPGHGRLIVHEWNRRLGGYSYYGSVWLVGDGSLGTFLALDITLDMSLWQIPFGVEFSSEEKPNRIRV